MVKLKCSFSPYLASGSTADFTRKIKGYLKLLSCRKV